MLRTNDTHFLFDMLEFNLGVVVFPMMYFRTSLNEDILCYSLNFTTCRTLMAFQMTIWRLPKFNVFRTNNTYLRFPVYIFYFAVVILVAMYIFRLFNELLCGFLWCTVTSWTARSSHMIIRCYPEFTMFWAYNTDLFFIVNIFHF